MTSYLLTAFGLLFLLIGLRLLWRNWRTTGWVETQGSIISSEVEEYENVDLVTHYRAKISYAYDVDGETYVCAQIRRHEPGYDRRSIAEARVRQYPVDKDVKVYFNPNDPGEAVLDRGFHWSEYAFVGVGALLTFMGIMELLQRVT